MAEHRPGSVERTISPGQVITGGVTSATIAFGLTDTFLSELPSRLVNTLVEAPGKWEAPFPTPQAVSLARWPPKAIRTFFSPVPLATVKVNRMALTPLVRV